MNPSILPDQTVRVSYDPGLVTDKKIVLQDWAGNRVARFSDVEIRNDSSNNNSNVRNKTPSTVPAPLRAYVGDGANKVDIEFDRAIADSNLPNLSAFSATVDGENVQISARRRKAGEDHVLEITLSGSPRRGPPRTVSYTKPTSGFTLKGSNNQEVASFDNFIVHDTVVEFGFGITPRQGQFFLAGS